MIWKIPKAIFNAQVNNSPVDQHVIESKVNIALTSPLEEEKARIFCGLTLAEYSGLVGGRRWGKLSKNHFGNIVCKADVLVIYRMLSGSESVANHLITKRK